MTLPLLRRLAAPLLLGCLWAAVSSAAPAQTAPASGGAAPDATLSGGTALPPGVTPEQLLRGLGVQAQPASSQGAPAAAASAPPRVRDPAAFEAAAVAALDDGRIDPAEAQALAVRAREAGLTDDEAKAAVERLTQRRRDAVAALLPQVRLLAQADATVSERDRAFLEARARDRGLSAPAAAQTVAEALERQRKTLLYASFLKAFLDDRVLDASEEALLAAKRQELGISEVEHAEQLARIGDEVRRQGGPLDVLGGIRDRGAAAQLSTEGLTPYGQEIFQASPDSLAAPASLPPPDHYVLGPGDQVRVSLWGRLEAEYTLTVDPEGRVQLPRIGPVRLGGLTYAEARRALERRAEAITGVNASVSMSAMRPVQVFVVGEAMRPGSVTLSPFSTAVHAVMAAGGPTELGSLRGILLRRGGKVLSTVDLYDFLQKGDARGDRVLQSGDVVVLPKAARRAWLAGEVKRPAIYELREGEGLRALLDLAGGFSADAYGRRVQVERARGHEARRVLDVALADLKGDFALEDGDRVRVFRLSPEVENEVTLLGHVHRTGPRAFREGMRVSALVGGLDNLKPEVELGYAVVLRESGPDRVRAVLPFRLGAALDGSEPGEDLELRPRDEVYVFSRYQFQAPSQARASGEVRNPGVYRFERGARVADLVRLAGGLGPEALARRAELLRYLPDRARQTLYVDLEKALAGEPAENVALAENDELLVHSVWDAAYRQSVQVAGEVQRPGEIALTRDMTVRDLVFKAGGLTRGAHLPVAHLYRTDPATKEVTIHTFALGKALDGDAGENLVLQDGDRVTIHAASEFVPPQKVGLSGTVNKPGEYPYATNMRVRDLVLAGGGLKEEAFLSEAEIVRAEALGGEKAETRTLRFHLGRALEGDPDANLALKPYDKVFVKKIPDWRETERVDVLGEVAFPGSYYIAKGERLSSVLRRAGGFTGEAYLPAALFTRESARAQQQQRLDELRERLQQAILRASSQEAQGAMTPEDLAAQKQYLSSQQALLAKLDRVKATGRVVLKLPALEKLEGTDADVALEGGDTLTVPKMSQTVSVVGQVYNPTALLWEADRREVGHYLQKTGGPTPDAERDEIYVVRADGTVVSNGSLKAGNWWSRGIDGVELGPGDTVLVPEKVIRINYMREVRDITQILYQIAVTAGVVVALF